MKNEKRRTRVKLSNFVTAINKETPTTHVIRVPDVIASTCVTAINKETLTTHVIRVLLKFGANLLSHLSAVPSAHRGLTSLFGMGRGGSPWL